MMEHFLTKQTFRSGLTNYLNTQKYRAAEQDDLWEHLTEQGHKVSKIYLTLNTLYPTTDVILLLILSELGIFHT